MAGRKVKFGKDDSDDGLDDDILNEILDDGPVRGRQKAKVPEKKESTEQKTPEKRTESKTQLMQDLFLGESTKETKDLGKKSPLQNQTIDKGKEDDSLQLPIKATPRNQNTAQVASTITLDKKDDLLGASSDLKRTQDGASRGSRAAKTASVMDDLFGPPKGGAGSKSSFMDDLLSTKEAPAPRQSHSAAEKEFVLDSKYKQAAADTKTDGLDFGGSDNFGAQPPRRRRGNPTLGSNAGAGNKSNALDLFDDPPKSNQPRKEKEAPSQQQPNEEANPFPWMAKKSSAPAPSSQSGGQGQQQPVPAQQQPHPQGYQQQPPIQAVAQQQIPAAMPSQGLGMVGQFQPAPEAMAVMQPPPMVAGRQELSQQERQQQEAFNRELDAFNQMMSARRAEYAAALERQRRQLEQSVLDLQQKQQRMSQQQADQSQALLSKLHQQLDAEANMKQQMMLNQVHLLTKMQGDLPSSLISGDLTEMMEKLKETESQDKNEMENLIKTKIKEMEAIFKAKEERIIDNYDQVVKDLEQKLDLAHERLRQQVEDSREEKEQINEGHKKEIEKLHESHADNLDRIKVEYINVIDRLKELRKVEVDSIWEMQEKTLSISTLAATLDTNSKEVEVMRRKMESGLTSVLDSREHILQQKNQQLMKIQETLQKKQDENDEERKKLLEMIQDLRTQATEKQEEVDRERREIAYEKQRCELDRKAFEVEKSSLRKSVEKERRDLRLDYEQRITELNKIKSQLAENEKQLREERYIYMVHKRINPDEKEDNNDDSIGGMNNTHNNQEIEVIMKALEYEKGTIRSQKETLKKRQAKLETEKGRIGQQKREIMAVIEQLFIVEQGINDKFRELDDMKHVFEKIKSEANNCEKSSDALEEKMLNAMEEIQDALVDVMKQEQRVRAEKMALQSERKHVEKARLEGVCLFCAAPLKRAFSARDIRGPDMERSGMRTGKMQTFFGNEDDIPLQRVRSSAWAEPDARPASRSNVYSRDGLDQRLKGDGASFEALDSTMSGIRREADIDQRYLRDEKRFLKSVQQINMKTVNKYHL